MKELDSYPVPQVLMGISSGLVSQNFNTITFVCPFARNGTNATEASRQITTVTQIKTALFMVRCSVNTLDSTCTVRPRNAGADGNQLVTIPAASTVTIQDTTNTDTIPILTTFGYELDTNVSTSGAVTLSFILHTSENQ